MNTHHHRIGHILHVSGLFMLLFVATIFLPVNSALTRAFGSSEIYELSNKARTTINANPLSNNLQLSSAAQAKAEDMVKKQYFQHVAPDGTTPWKYFADAGYSYQLAGENLAITNESAEAVIQGWLDSPTHRDNLLNNEYSDMGIGIANYGTYQGHKNTIVVVAFYGKATGSQNPLAATSPAGTTAALKPRYLQTSPALLASIAGSLVVIGALLEAHHVYKTHRKHQSQPTDS